MCRLGGYEIAWLKAYIRARMPPVMEYSVHDRTRSSEFIGKKI